MTLTGKIIKADKITCRAYYKLQLTDMMFVADLKFELQI